MKRNLSKIAFIILSIFSFLPEANAQTVERRSITLDGARTVIAAAKEYARKNNAPGGVIAVVDEGGNLVALERLDGTFSAGANISVGKAKTAVMFKRPTKFFEDVIKNGRTAMVALPDFTPLQGGVPIMIDGQLVGGVGVSGAMSAVQDEELAIAGAEALTNRKCCRFLSSTAKRYRTHLQKVPCSRTARTAKTIWFTPAAAKRPGMSEVHELDTDIIYVLDGTATFVTGGKSVDPKMVAANEFRGIDDRRRRDARTEERRCRYCPQRHAALVQTS